MNSAALPSTAADAGASAVQPPEHSSEVLHLVSLSQNEDAAIAVRLKVLSLVSKFLTPFEVHPDEWTFDDLAHDHFAAEAAELASCCDLFTLSTTDPNHLPPNVLGWLELWGRTREARESALVCLVGSEEGNQLDSPVHRTLQEFARRHSITFFAGAFSVRSDRTLPSLTQLDWQATEHWDRWGINE